MTIYVERAWQWLIYSSTNSEKISIAIKGAISAVLVGFSLFVGDINIPLLGDTLNQLIDAVIAFVQAVVGLVSIATTIVGLARKIWTTVKGTNAVVIGWQRA